LHGKARNPTITTLAAALLQLRRLPEALAAFETALRINPGMEQIQQYAELLRQQQGEAVSEE
jgi:cytochrome c-type biogenesis protein CcmH/NrfG